ncbi:hypothetical protein EON65_39260 [archaeon]|nr:MAG: hypothetical protein EON65_39260 [archaeon]
MTVYRLLTRKSYEMVMFKAASLKLGLDYAIMHNLKNGSAQGVGSGDGVGDGEAVGKKGKKGGKRGIDESSLQGISTTRAETFSSLSKRELENLLKHGAYDIFLEEKTGQEEEASKVFVEESIESILQRSSMFKHTSDNPNVECTKLGNNFAKASFISAGQADCDVAIDDPDFWTKVVGIGMDNGDDNGGERTSKRKRAVDNYREPTDSIRSIYGDLTSAYRTDSDSDNDSEKKAGIKRRRRDVDEDVPAVYNAENMSALCNVLYAYGYGNWKSLRTHSKLHWAVEDMIKSSLTCTAYTLMLACVSLDKTQTEEYSSLNAISKRVDYDLFESLVKKNKLCKLVVYMVMHVVNQAEDNQSVAYNDIHTTVWNKVMSGLKSCLCKPNAVVDMLVDVYTSSLSFELLNFSTSHAQTSEDNTEQPYYVALQTLLSFVSEQTSIEDMAKPLLEEADPGKLIKKLNSYKLRLQELEDLFEAHVLQSVMSSVDGDGDGRDRAKDECEGEDEGEGKTETTKEEGAESAMYFTTLRTLIEQDNLLLNHPHANTPSTLNNQGESVWSAALDMHLLQAVGLYGWPDGRKRLRHVVNYMVMAMPTVFVPVEVVADEKVAEVREEVGMDKTETRGEGEPESNVVEMEVAGRDVVENVAVGDATAPVVKKEVVYTNSEYLTSKFLSTRLRCLSKLFRYAIEDIQAVQKAEQIVKQTEANARGRKVQSILKCIQRIGCVRSVYGQLHEKLRRDGDDDISYLLTWEKFCAECGYEANSPTIQEVKGICSALFNLLHPTPSDGQNDGEGEDAVYAEYIKDVDTKQLSTAFEHVDTIHRIRMMLVLYSKEDIIEIINRNCKVMGKFTSQYTIHHSPYHQHPMCYRLVGPNLPSRHDPSLLVEH